MLQTPEELALAAQMAGCYMMTLSTLEGGKLNHTLLINKFPDGDCIRAWVKIEPMIVDHLKKAALEDNLEGG